MLPLGGQWEELGVDRWRGIEPVGLNPKADEGGPAELNFTIDRPTDRLHADLQALTPCEVLINEKLVWSGLVRETPAQGGLDGQITIQGFGYQRNLDDDQYRALYLHTKLSEWKDSRSFLTCSLATYKTAGTISQDRGIILGFSKGANVPNGTRVGVTLDLGPGGLAKTVDYKVTWRNGHTTNFALLISGTDAENPLDGTAEQIVNSGIAGGTAETSVAANGAAFTNPHQYVHIWLQNTGGDAAALADDVYVKIEWVIVSANAGWISSHASNLKATDVIKDAFAHCVQVDPSTALIAQTSFNIPDLYELAAPRTPRQFGDRANSYHKYQVRVRPDKKPEFRALPSVPLFEVKDAAAFDDASVSSAEDVVNKVIVTGEGGDQSPLEVVRYASEALPSGLFDGIAWPTNPSFDVDASGWLLVPAGGTFVRTTTAGEFDSAPGAGKWSALNARQYLVELFDNTKTFKAGTIYRFTWKMKGSGGTVIPHLGYRLNGPDGVSDPTDDFAVQAAFATPAGFTAYTILWAPHRDIPAGSARFWLTSMTNSQTVIVDTISLARGGPTIADARGFIQCRTLECRSPTNTTAMQTLADAYLKSHQVTPMRGSLRAMAGGVGDATVTWLKGGAPVHPSELLLNTCELILFSTLLDPATGARGRVGMIKDADYDDASESAKVSIDSTRNNLEALMARMDVVVGAGQ